MLAAEYRYEWFNCILTRIINQFCRVKAEHLCKLTATCIKVSPQGVNLLLSFINSNEHSMAFHKTTYMTRLTTWYNTTGQLLIAYNVSRHDAQTANVSLIIFFVFVVHFTTYITGLSSMMLI